MSSSKDGKINDTKCESNVNLKPLTEWNPRFSLAKLSNPDRIQMILQHRGEIGGLGKMFAQSERTVSRRSRTETRMHLTNLKTINPGGKEKLPSNFTGLKSIKLRDMDPYEYYSVGDKIELEIIEDAMSFTRVMLMGQDSAGDVIFVALYCDSPSTQDDDLQQKVGYGCKISIANPWLKFALDGRKMIRVEDDGALFIHKSRDPQKCRFCGNANSEKKCARCKRAYYCSRECQTHDWKILKHKEICDGYVWVRQQTEI